MREEERLRTEEERLRKRLKEIEDAKRKAKTFSKHQWSASFNLPPSSLASSISLASA